MSTKINAYPAKKVKAIESDFYADALVGARSDEYGDSGYVWALFNRKDIPQSLIDESLDPDSECDLAYHLTGWTAFSRGVGRMFGSAPGCVIGRNRILVRQFRGLDI